MSVRYSILIVEDDPELVKTLQVNFQSRGYRCFVGTSAAQGLELFRAEQPRLVVLDLGLPDLDGMELLKLIRNEGTTPILVLTGRTELEKKLHALDMGADDYVTKPFDIEELFLRVNAILRRASEKVPATSYRMGDWDIDVAKARIVNRLNSEIEAHLTPLEWKLLVYLLVRAGTLVSPKELLQSVWGPEYGTQSNYLRLFISQLRKKLEPVPTMPKYILTETGIGYRLKLDEADEAPDAATS
jgi:two-component system KDP operon response regulator KdpE